MRGWCARVLGVMGLISCGFLLFTLLTSNPFERLLPAAADGQDLNPLLQDPGMVIHPPHAVHGLCRLCCGLCLCRVRRCWLVGWTPPGRAGRGPGPRWPWCFLTLGIATGQLLGLLRTGLGWLVVLGSGGERLLHALAGRHRSDPLSRGD